LSLISWNDSMSVNVDEIDNQHKKLLDIINELHEAILKRKPRKILLKILGEMTDYSVYHFKTEEKYFDKFNYPDKKSHVKEHEDFINHIIEFTNGYKEQRILLSMDMINFLKDWLYNHIMEEDHKYSEFLNEHGLF